jgi:hypothetical protein
MKNLLFGQDIRADFAGDRPRALDRDCGSLPPSWGIRSCAAKPVWQREKTTMKNITPNHGITQNHGMAAPTRRNVLKSAATFAALASIGGAGRAAAADAEPEVVMDGHVAIGLDMVAGR